jgi:outer membrane protein OmpA-like peptidoglycan-associated protein
MIARRCLTAVLLLAGVTGAAAAPLDVTGTWSPKYWTLRISLRQQGDQVWGFGGAKDFWFRGRWDGDRLLLVSTNFNPARKGTCTPRGLFALSGKTVTSLDALWVRDPQKPLRGPWARLSPDPGQATDYPYAQELTQCGFLRTYELSFATASDQLQGTDWPLLAAVADVLKKNAGQKIEVSGHTDSTGDAKKNQELSERRAASVKNILVERYGADAQRITTKGWGASQPIADNQSVDGKALNRRVEIVVSH